MPFAKAMHDIDWKSAKILDREKKRRSRQVKEALWIKQKKTTLNKDKGNWQNLVDGVVARRRELQLLRAYIACRYIRACNSYTQLKPLQLGLVTYTSLESFSFQKVLISLFSAQSFVSFPLSNVFRLHFLHVFKPMLSLHYIQTWRRLGQPGPKRRQKRLLLVVEKSGN